MGVESVSPSSAERPDSKPEPDDASTAGASGDVFTRPEEAPHIKEADEAWVPFSSERPAAATPANSTAASTPTTGTPPGKIIIMAKATEGNDTPDGTYVRVRVYPEAESAQSEPPEPPDIITRILQQGGILFGDADREKQPFRDPFRDDKPIGPLVEIERPSVPNAYPEAATEDGKDSRPKKPEEEATPPETLEAPAEADKPAAEADDGSPASDEDATDKDADKKEPEPAPEAETKSEEEPEPADPEEAEDKSAPDQAPTSSQEGAESAKEKVTTDPVPKVSLEKPAVPVPPRADAASEQTKPASPAEVLPSSPTDTTTAPADRGEPAPFRAVDSTEAPSGAPEVVVHAFKEHFNEGGAESAPTSQPKIREVTGRAVDRAYKALESAVESLSGAIGKTVVQVGTRTVETIEVAVGSNVRVAIAKEENAGHKAAVSRYYVATCKRDQEGKPIMGTGHTGQRGGIFSFGKERQPLILKRSVDGPGAPTNIYELKAIVDNTERMIQAIEAGERPTFKEFLRFIGGVIQAETTVRRGHNTPYVWHQREYAKNKDKQRAA